MNKMSKILNSSKLYEPNNNRKKGSLYVTTKKSLVSPNSRKLTCTQLTLRSTFEILFLIREIIPLLIKNHQGTIWLEGTDALRSNLSDER